MKRLLLAVLLAASAGRADVVRDGLELHALADVYAAYDAHHGDNFLPGTGTTAAKANQFDLNAAALELLLPPTPVGFHLTLAFGSGVDVVHAAEPRAFANVFQASVAWNAPVGSGLLIEAGIYPSHIGYESFFSKDNWNYTRSWMGEYSPYYQTGVKLSYAFTPEWSAQLHFLNGWQNIRDDNRAKAVGTQLAYNGARVSLALNTFAGPELPGDDSHWRVFGDVTAQLKLDARWALGATVDVGRQALPSGAAVWDAGAVYARFAWSAALAVAVRAELYDDRDGFISGTPQRLREATATVEVHPAEHLILKGEARVDGSGRRVFAGSTSEAVFVASAVASF